MLGSVFVQCRLRPLTFDEVDFSLATLGGNDLRGVDLSGCRLRETSLVETDLRKAVLRGADLSGARTTGARLDEADLRGATVDTSLGPPPSWREPASTWPQALAYAAAHGLRLDAGGGGLAFEPDVPPHDDGIDHESARTAFAMSNTHALLVCSQWLSWGSSEPGTSAARSTVGHRRRVAPPRRHRPGQLVEEEPPGHRDQAARKHQLQT